MTTTITTSPIEAMQHWLKNFLSERVRKPGFPLWSLKVTDAELNQLNKLIKLQFQAKSPSVVINKSNIFDRIFTLYIATWLQRNYTGGISKWPPVFQSVGIDDYKKYYGAIQESVNRGLKLWGIDIHHAGSQDVYFATLYCQGGFPTSALTGQLKGHVPDYLYKVIEYYRQFHHTDTAKSIADKSLEGLPKTLRQDSFARLAASLIETLLLLRDEYHLYSAKDPVLKLDVEKPNWRDDLPFLLCDESAHELMSKLLSKASSIIRRAQNPIRVSRFLEKGLESWQLVAETHINRTIHPDDLHECLKVGSLPKFFDLYTQIENGARSRSASFNLKGSGTTRWQVITNDTRFFNTDAAGELIYSLWSNQNKIETATYYRGEGLNASLPWVFQSANENIRYVNQGSTSIALDEAIVLFSGDVIAANASSVVEHIGNANKLEMNVFRVRGEALAVAAGGNFKISTACIESKPLHCWFDGSKVDEAVSAKHVFRGVPSIQFRLGDDVFDSVPKEQIYWNSTECSSPTSILSDTKIEGKGTLSWIDNTELKWQSSVSIIPEKALFDIVPPELGEMELKLLNFGDINIGLAPAQAEWLRDVEKYEDMYLCDIRLPTRIVDCINPVLSWGENNHIEFELPTQQTGVCLITPKGRPFIQTHSTLTLDDLYTHKLRVGKLLPSPNQVLKISAALFSEHKMLTNLTDQVFLDDGLINVITSEKLASMANMLFSQSDSIRSFVTFKFFLNGNEVESTVSKVELYRHSTPNFYDDDRKILGVKVTKSRSHSDRNMIDMYAVPIWDLGRERIVLDRIPNHRSDVIFGLPDTEEFGPWFIYSDPQNKIQPRVVLIGEQGEEPEHQGNKTLEHATKYLTFDFIYMDSFIKELSDNWDHCEWSKLSSLVDALGYATANTFHLYRRLLLNPQAMVHLLLKQTEQKDFEKIWELARELPFEWLNIPVDCWLQSIKGVISDYDKQLHSVKSKVSIDGYSSLLHNLIDTHLDALNMKGDYFSTMIEICKHQLLEVSPSWLNCDEYSILAQFNLQKSELFSRHNGRVLSEIQTYRKDQSLKIFIDEYYNDDGLATLLSRFLQPSYLDSAKRSRYIFSLDLPMKLAFKNSDVLDVYELPKYGEKTLHTMYRDENFVLARLQQFDRTWLNQAMACGLKAAYIYKLQQQEER